MTKKELIEELNKFPEDNLILVIPVENNSTGYIYVEKVVRGINELDGCLFIEGNE